MRQRMPKRPTKHVQFWKDVYSLLERFPAAFPVVVTVISQDPSKDWAWCTKRGKLFSITVQEIVSPDDGLVYDWMMNSFLHELGHVLCWSHRHDVQEHARWHDETWGVWFARLYSAWSKDP